MPDSMADYIEARVRAGQFGNDSEYFRDLVRKDQERQTGIAELQKLIDESLASGVSNKSIDQLFDEARARARRVRAHGL